MVLIQVGELLPTMANQNPVEGEGTYVSALDSLSYNRINLVLTNYDPEEKIPKWYQF